MKHKHPMKRWGKWALIAAGAIVVAWTALTIWVELPGPAMLTDRGDPAWDRHALIVYDPDPIYDLDAQVCQAFAEGLASDSVRSTIATVAAAEGIGPEPFDLYVFCANTYNWRPDRAITGFIENRRDLRGRSVVAITLGSGSTEAAQGALEAHIHAKGALLLDSRSLWLLRPNDETRMEERNVDVALEQVRELAARIGRRMGRQTS